MLTTNRNNWVDNLRSALTLLVVAHHSSLAYTTFARFNPGHYAASTHPIVDTARWIGLDIFEDFNDVFFMSLLFLISGLFVRAGLDKKGAGVFVRDRFYRLFIPFVVGVSVLMPIAYYPSYRVATHGGFGWAYLKDFFIGQGWPAGPPWFIWLLFAFNLIVVGVYPLVRGGLARVGDWLAAKSRHSWLIVLGWWVVAWLAYVPIVLHVEAGSWTGLGPFAFQVSRILLYFCLFLLGVLLGQTSLERGWFADASPLVKKWAVWVIGALAAYTLLKVCVTPLLRLYVEGEITGLQGSLIYRSIWILSCTLSSVAFLTLFKRWLGQRRWQSLAENAYGIYLVHYIFVIWCQYFLLNYPLPAAAKFLITFSLSVMLSWGLVGLVRRNALVRRYL